MPTFLTKHIPDVKEGNINWKSYAIDEEGVRKFIEAVGSIGDEGVESDSVNEFNEDNSGCEVYFSDNFLYTGIPDSADDMDYWEYCGFIIASLYSAEIAYSEGSFEMNGNEVATDVALGHFEDEIFQMVFNEDENVNVGVGLLRRK